MAHWYNMKVSGIAKTVDMITVITSALFVSFKESHKWNPIHGGRKLWNSVLLMGGVTYVVNAVVLSVPVLLPIDDERLQLATTVAHTFWLHVMKNVTAMWCVWCESCV
jgi:predicted membrane chloride channel (bestrophin family)